MFISESLHWLGAFKCLILTTNERVGLSLHWLEVFKYLYQCHCLGWGYLNQKWWNDVTYLLTDTRTQPFIVKDNVSQKMYAGTRMYVCKIFQGQVFVPFFHYSPQSTSSFDWCINSTQLNPFIQWMSMSIHYRPLKASYFDVICKGRI